MSTAMRAKLQVSSVEKFGASVKVNFIAASKSGAYAQDGSDEDNTYAKWTPTASCSLNITNPALLGKFAPGDKFYVDFRSAD